MEIPFTAQQFLSVLQTYSHAIWPVQWIAYALGIVAIIMAINALPYANTPITGILAAFWIWSGGIFFFLFFSEIAPAAYLIGTLFLIQGILFLSIGLGKTPLQFRVRLDAYGLLGSSFALYAVVIYPFLGAILAHGEPMPGTAPCATTMLTLSLLLWTERPVATSLLIIPGVASLFGVMAVLHMNLLEQFMLPIAGLVTVGMLIYRDRAGHTQLIAQRAG